MKTFKERAEELALACTRVKNNGVYETLAKEFGIGKRTAGDRFKSIFGKPVSEFISENNTPSKEKLIDCLIQSDDFNEFLKLSGITYAEKLVNLLKTYFGQSNYYKLKVTALSKMPCKEYNPTLADNEALLVSQILGDGHIERESSFKIEHGHKQYDYLKFKVSLFNKAFPETNGLDHIKKRISNVGYESYSWRSGQVLGKQLNKLIHLDKEDLVNKLTPFGICLYFLDDGSFYESVGEYITWGLEFACPEETSLILQKYFETYGYKFNIVKGKGIALQSKSEIIKFIKDFIEPFDEIIPECMKYKYNLEDKVGKI